MQDLSTLDAKLVFLYLSVHATGSRQTEIRTSIIYIIHKTVTFPQRARP